MDTWPTRLRPHHIYVMQVLAASGRTLPGEPFASLFAALPSHVSRAALHALIEERYIAPSGMADHTWALTWRGLARLEEES